MSDFEIEKLIHGNTKEFEFESTISLDDLAFKSFKDVGVVEYCNHLPRGSKWPRMSKKKLAYINLKSVEEGYRGANQIANAEDSRFIILVRDKSNKKVKRRKRGNRRDYSLMCIGARRGPTSPQLVYTKKQTIKALGD